MSILASLKKLSRKRGRLLAGLIGTLLETGLSAVPVLGPLAKILADMGKEVADIILDPEAAEKSLSDEQLKQVNDALDLVQRTHKDVLDRLERLNLPDHVAIEELQKQIRQCLEARDSLWPLVCLVLGLPTLLAIAIFWLAGNRSKTPQPIAEAPGWPADAPRSVTNSIGLDLLLIPAGTFTMGSPGSESGRRDDEELHNVEITCSFYLGKFEVTQKQFEAVMGFNPSHFSPRGKGREKIKGLDPSDFPVENVTWHAAARFCGKLSAVPAEKQTGRRYRLPWEAEWEYACRGGSKVHRVFHYGDTLSSRQANVDGTQPYGAPPGEFLQRPVAVNASGYEPNGFGLSHMHGNVWEWCQDWYDEEGSSSSPLRDPTGPKQGKERVFRGGSWNSPGLGCRSAYRNSLAPARCSGNLGFRVVCVPAHP